MLLGEAAEIILRDEALMLCPQCIQADQPLKTRMTCIVCDGRGILVTTSYARACFVLGMDFGPYSEYRVFGDVR